jgi:hypothetical protein
MHDETSLCTPGQQLIGVLTMNVACAVAACSMCAFALTAPSPAAVRQ